MRPVPSWMGNSAFASPDGMERAGVWCWTTACLCEVGIMLGLFGWVWALVNVEYVVNKRCMERAVSRWQIGLFAESLYCAKQRV